MVVDFIAGLFQFPWIHVIREFSESEWQWIINLIKGANPPSQLWKLYPDLFVGVHPDILYVRYGLRSEVTWSEPEGHVHCTVVIGTHVVHTWFTCETIIGLRFLPLHNRCSGNLLRVYVIEITVMSASHWPGNITWCPPNPLIGSIGSGCTESTIWLDAAAVAGWRWCCKSSDKSYAPFYWGT